MPVLPSEGQKPPASELLAWMERFEAEQREINVLIRTNFRAVRWEGMGIGFVAGGVVGALFMFVLRVLS